MSNNLVWEKIFHKYQKADWIDKPSIFAQETKRYFKGKRVLLDLGAGLGQDSKYFSESGFLVTWSDSSKRALQLAKKRVDENKVKFILLNLENKLPFKNESFDIVYSHLALHYFDDKKTKELFREIYRILKKGGVFAALFNTIDDPEIKTENFTKIAENYYQEDNGLKKRYFSVDYLNDITKDLFSTIVADNKGKTYKDNIETLIRFVGTKK